MRCIVAPVLQASHLALRRDRCSCISDSNPCFAWPYWWQLFPALWDTWSYPLLSEWPTVLHHYCKLLVCSCLTHWPNIHFCVKFLKVVFFVSLCPLCFCVHSFLLWWARWDGLEFLTFSDYTTPLAVWANMLCSPFSTAADEVSTLGLLSEHIRSARSRAFPMPGLRAAAA